MSTPYERDFLDIAQERYPGSTRVRPVGRVVRPSPTDDDVSWDRHPQRFKIAGVEREFFGIGALAEALGREPGTIRKWEREGVVPTAPFRKPSADPRGSRRLYSREQVEGIVRIAHEEGLTDASRKVPITSAFTTKVLALFKELREQ